jgi:oxygen-independent coproporphyrinogen-3 oxidase
LNGGARYFAPAILSDDVIADMYAGAMDVLSKQGLAQYEISNFARDGAESVHNNRYWLRRPYLGLGVDAHSMLRNASGEAIRFAATDDLQSYLSSPGWNEFHTLTRQEEMEEAWFLGLRLNAGVRLSRLEAEFGEEAIRQFQPVLQELCSRDLLKMKGGSIALTTRGRLLSNEVFAQFLDVMEITDPVTV